MSASARVVTEPHAEPVSAADPMDPVADGNVSVNRVRAHLAADAQIPPRKSSAIGAVFTGPGKPVKKLPDWGLCSGSTSGNDARPFPMRRWSGAGIRVAVHPSHGVPA